MTLKSFPRGGKKPIVKPSHDLFTKKIKTKTKHQKNKVKPVEEISIQDETIVSNTAENLRYSTLQEGMVLLGRIFKITDYYAIISLPGQITAKLQATDISETYTNFLKNIAKNEEVSCEFKPLLDLYKEGDYVVCHIKEKSSKGVLVSLEPQLVNQNLDPSTLVRRSKVVLSVSSIEEHGCVLETGHNNFRAFLPSKYLEDNETKLYIGKQVTCAVIDVKAIDNIITATVSIKPKHVNTIVSNILALNNLIPGSQYSLKINKILKNGLQVQFGKDHIGYINQLHLPNVISSYQKGQDLEGTLLYLLPTVKFAYFCLMSGKPEIRPLAVGDLITEAKVLFKESKGVVLNLTKKVRGFLPLKRTEVDYEKITSIFSKGSIHKCKIMAYDSIARLYICTMEKKLLETEYVNKINLQPGNLVKVTITRIDKNTGYVSVSIGNVRGTVSPNEVLDPGSINKPKVGETVSARVLESSNKLYFTLKKSLIESKLPILSKIDDAKVNAVHDGTVIKIQNTGVLVRFFDKAFGWIPNHFLNTSTASENWNLVLGQTISVMIKNINIDKNRITLALSKGAQFKNIKYRVGSVVEGVVIDSSSNGVHLRLKQDNNEDGITGFLPAGHMSPCNDVGRLLAAKTVAGDVLTAIVFSVNPSLILSTTFAPQEIYQFNNLNIESTVLCSIKDIKKDCVKVLLPMEKYSKQGTVPLSRVGNCESIYENQILFGKVIKIDKQRREIDLTTQLSDIWKKITGSEEKMMTAVDVLTLYLSKISELSKNVYYTSKCISKIKIGQKLKGTVKGIMDSGVILILDNGLKGIVRSDNVCKNCKEGDEVEGAVLWINYPHELIELTLKQHHINSICMNKNETNEIPMSTQLRGEIVLVTEWFVLVLLKGDSTGTLVAMPVRRHLNDTVPNLSVYKIGAKVRCYGILNKGEANLFLPLCILKSAFENIDLKKKTSILPNPKRKIKSEDDSEAVPAAKKLKIISIENTKKLNSMEVDEHDEEKDKDEKVSKNSNSGPLINLTMSECGFQWDASKPTSAIQDSSSDSEDELEDSTKIKKKKLTPAEKREIERQKEREIREREEALASCQLPQTVDQFDRLVLSSPDSSLVWMQYMAYHLQATEIEKARSVARRALKTINFREEDERLNVWHAWLNLESRFGSTELLTEVFQEAIKTNDAHKVYTHMLTVHVDAGRQLELEKITNAMIAKFKQNPETWISCGAAYLKIGLKEKSRHVMQRALQSLPPNQHINLMVRFAQLENKFGDKERAQTLFEQILSSYPKRTDVWSTYVDSLIKSGDLDIARKVLDRAIAQTLPAKKMKVLFKKYVSFEENHGTAENVSHIKMLALKYVEERCKKE